MPTPHFLFSKSFFPIFAMMIYPDNFEKKIGFDVIRQMLADACVSDLGKGFVDKIRFSTKVEIVRRMHRQLSEFRQIIDLGKSFPVSGFFDLRPELYRLKTDGTYLSVESLFDFKTSLTVIGEILHFFQATEEGDFPELKSLTVGFEFPAILLKEAQRIIDEKGAIKDNASAKLAEIRIKINHKQRQVIAETRKAYQVAKKSGYLPDGAEMTIRNGRAVIPVKASDKRAVKGFIHDESSSGQTVFIEPVTSFEVNNEIVELENEEHREIIRILTLYSDRVRPEIPSLLLGFRFLGLVDFIRAKALIAIRLQASSPVFTQDNLLLNHAIHPLLFLSHSQLGKEVIPLDLSLTKENRILIISGPNAGGKSVCLKTFGLLQYMFQCGLQIPASPNSELPLFENLFIDIGDEQSLENDLSTYSSHLLDMKFFLKNANSKSLILIDEFGTGTEPLLGGAIAEATLEQLAHKGAFGLITTHYINLKLAADKIPGLMNGAMLFDTKKMQPLYQMKMGKPGSSFAFEIAKKIGFPQDVLNRAQKKSGGQHLSFDKQLQQLEAEKLSVASQQQALIKKEMALKTLREKYDTLFNELKKSKKEIIQQAHSDALELLKHSNKEIEKTIREIKEAHADKNKTKALRHHLEAKKSELEKRTSKEKITSEKKANKKGVEKIITDNDAIKAGDFVEIAGMDVIGEVLSVEGMDAVVNVNNVKLSTALKKLSKTDRTPKTLTKQRFQSNIVNDLNEKVAHFELSIDLRGKRAEEAMELLTRYLDDAILLNIKEVSILHGKGYGILREVIREHLRSFSEIKQFSDAPVDRGGAGITRVVFK